MVRAPSMSETHNAVVPAMATILLRARVRDMIAFVTKDLPRPALPVMKCKCDVGVEEGGLWISLSRVSYIEHWSGDMRFNAASTSACKAVAWGAKYSSSDRISIERDATVGSRKIELEVTRSCKKWSMSDNA